MQQLSDTKIQSDFFIEGMDCPEEEKALKKALRNLPGIIEIKTNLINKRLIVVHQINIKAGELVKEITKLGLSAVPFGNNDKVQNSNMNNHMHLVVVVASACLTAIGLILEWKTTEVFLTRTLFAFAIISDGWFLFPKTLRALRQKSLDMNVLMIVAVIGATIIGEWSEGAVVMTLFSISELLEMRSVARARKAIQSLLNISPETAWVNRGGNFVEARVEEISLGDVIAVKSGSRVPLDGLIKNGQSSVNQAPITGESMPVDKKIGDIVFAGTINESGQLEIQVTKKYNDTTLARIIHLIENAQDQKASSQKFVDKFAKIYTPVVFILALLLLAFGPLIFGGVFNLWIYRSLVLLVIACPCALVISTPVSVVSGLAAMARQGVLIKGGAFLEDLGKLKALAVDKTGTITEGRPRVVNVSVLGAKSAGEVIRIAAALDVHSEHPLARAVLEYAKSMNVEYPRSRDYKMIAGRGAQGYVDDHLYFVGNHRFAHEQFVCSDVVEQSLRAIEEMALSVVVVGHAPHDGHKGDVLGILAVGDAVRSNAKSAIRALHEAGIKQIVMLSGDNQRTVNAISKQVGIDEAYGDLLPDDKILRVKELLDKHKFVGMIGDGVNDAPAMAVASLGIAMGAGTDTAIETAHMTLMQDDLAQVAKAIKLGRKTLTIIRTNIIFSITVKSLFLALALGGIASLWLAILADTGATLIVTLNALRLLRPTH